MTAGAHNIGPSLVSRGIVVRTPCLLLHRRKEMTVNFYQEMRIFIYQKAMTVSFRYSKAFEKLEGGREEPRKVESKTKDYFYTNKHTHGVNSDPSDRVSASFRRGTLAAMWPHWIVRSGFAGHGQDALCTLVFR